MAKVSSIVFGSGSPASGIFLLLVVAYQNGVTCIPPGNFSLVRRTTGSSFTADIYSATAGSSEPAAYTINFSALTETALAFVALSNVDSVLGTSGTATIGSTPTTAVPPVAVVPAGSVAVSVFFSTAGLIAPNAVSPLPGANSTGSLACATALIPVSSPLHSVVMGTSPSAQYIALEIVLSPVSGQSIGLGGPDSTPFHALAGSTN
jgi:hypothetical protein